MIRARNLLLPLPLLVAGCSLLAGLQTAHAQAESRTYAPGSFDAVEISGSATVRFTQGAADQVVITGDEDRQKTVAVELRGNTLSIRPEGAWKFWTSSQRVEVAITARQLSRVAISGAADWHAPGPVDTDRLAISISGAGLARFDQLKADRLSFAIAGAGDGQVAGTARELRVAVSGRSDFRAAELMTDSARVAVSGIGDVKVWAQQSLTISVAGLATVDYWGSPPEVKRSVSGRATINDRGPKKPLP